MNVARLRLALRGGNGRFTRSVPGKQSPPTRGANGAPRSPSPNPLAPQQPLGAAPAMSVAATGFRRGLEVIR